MLVSFKDRVFSLIEWFGFSLNENFHSQGELIHTLVNVDRYREQRNDKL